MRKKTRTEITIETSRVMVIRQRPTSVRAWCHRCRKPVKMTTADEAASAAGVTSRAIYRWVEAEMVHFRETPEGRLLICLNSLPKK
jgi:hypothetical protein